MKNKDYVGQSKKPAKGKAKTTDKKPFPVVKLIILAILVGTFAYFLFYLKDNSSFETTTPKETSSKKEKSKQHTLPPPIQDEEWEFIEELENKEVAVETEELEDKGPFVLRCATLRSKERAEGLKAQIAFAGFESTIKAYQGSSGLWHRVDLGPFEKKREAEKVRHNLKRNNINGCKIWLWQ